MRSILKSLEPDSVVRRAAAHLTPNHRFAFLSAFIIGVATHLFLFTNYLLNHDTAHMLIFDEDMTFSGRWFLKIACLPSSTVNLPWLIGLLCVLYLSLTAVLIADLFALRRKTVILLVNAVLLTFPYLASTFSYLACADGYMLALLLATLGVWLCHKWKYGILPGILCLALSLGTYQAYLSFAALLILFRLLFDVLDTETHWRRILWRLARYLILAVAAFALYYLILRLCMWATGTSLLAYQGIGSALGDPLAFLGNLPALLGLAYTQFFPCLTGLPGFGTLHRLVLGLYFVLALAALVLLVVRSFKTRHPLRYVAAAVLLAAVPPAANLFLIAGAESFHALMRLPYCLIFILPLLLIDRLPARSQPVQLCKWATLLLCLGLCLQFFITTNTVYTSMSLRMERAYSLTARLVDRIEQTEGYAPDLPIVILGRPDGAYYQSTFLLDPLLGDMPGVGGGDFVGHYYILYHYMRDFHHFDHPIHPYAYEQDRFITNPEIQAMGVFPEASSVMIFHDEDTDIIIVRLGEEPTL